jgi:hypothetical protein
MYKYKDMKGKQEKGRRQIKRLKNGRMVRNFF